MAGKEAKIQLRTTSTFIDLTMELRNLKKERERLSKDSTKGIVHIKEAVKEEPEQHEQQSPTKRIYLYIQLQSISNLPESREKLKITLNHVKDTITKLEDHYTKSKDIEISRLNDIKPTFSITIDQDSIEDINAFSDNPLQVTLYRVIPKSNENAEDDADNESLEVVAQGHMDLLEFFSKKRSINKIITFLYLSSELYTDFKSANAVKTSWEIYSLLPLLKEIEFCNIAFITFESIYNIKSDILSIGDQLVAEVSFQSKLRNEKNEFDKIKICTFNSFEEKLINDQNPNQQWESMSENNENVNPLALQSGCTVNLHKLFRNLLCTEGVDFNFEAIDKYEDVVLVSNKMHRFVLTEELGNILQEVIAFNEQHILVEIYNNNEPEDILLQGILELPVLLYPKVNACRFAVNLYPKNQRINPENNEKSPKGKKLQSASRTSPKSNEKPFFAILNICLMSPITDPCKQMSLFTGQKINKSILNCVPADQYVLNVIKTSGEVCEETYKSFDEQIGILIDFIVRKEVKTLDDAKRVLCCQLENLSNKILKMVACDFNIRFPTKTNIEFNRLMTTVYKELEQRIYNILKNCSNNNSRLCYVTKASIQDKIIKFMSMMKYLDEVGDVELSGFLFEKTRKLNENDTCINFFLFLYNMEKQNFDTAKEYMAKPMKEKYSTGEYFIGIIDIYINYMNIKNDEITFNQALEYLLEALKSFTEKNPRDVSAWILLHCVYKSCSYLPGMSFTRWRYEDMYDESQLQLPKIPQSRWKIYNNYELNGKTVKGKNYCAAIKLFLNLGLFKFAEIVFQEIQSEFTEVEKYFMTTTLKILLGEVPKKFACKNFPADKLTNADQIKAFQALINGNLEYCRDGTAAAMKNYERILDVKGIKDYENFQLGLLRYAYQMMDEQKYLKAARAFEKCCSLVGNCLAASFGMGKAMYRLDRFKEAEFYLSESTKYETHIPNIWGFLALVNLKMGNNFKALESWKYAKINPDNIIGEEVLEELRKINYNDLNLYVDSPFNIECV